MGFELLNPEQALQLVQEELPKIAGRGRTAKPYEMAEGVIAVGNQVAEMGGETNAPIAVGIPKVDGKIDPKALAEVVKMNRWAKDNGNTFHFVVRSESELAATVYVVAGPTVERKRKEKAEASEETDAE